MAKTPEFFSIEQFVRSEVMSDGFNKPEAVSNAGGNCSLPHENTCDDPNCGQSGKPKCK